MGIEMPKFTPIHTQSLILRQFSLDDVAKVYSMSQERGMRQWIPDQVYGNEEHATEALQYLNDNQSSRHQKHLHL